MCSSLLVKDGFEPTGCFVMCSILPPQKSNCRYKRWDVIIIIFIMWLDFQVKMNIWYAKSCDCISCYETSWYYHVNIWYEKSCDCISLCIQIVGTIGHIWHVIIWLNNLIVFFTKYPLITNYLYIKFYCSTILYCL